MLIGLTAVAIVINILAKANNYNIYVPKNPNYDIRVRRHINELHEAKDGDELRFRSSNDANDKLYESVDLKLKPNRFGDEFDEKRKGKYGDELRFRKSNNGKDNKLYEYDLKLKPNRLGDDFDEHSLQANPIINNHLTIDDNHDNYIVSKRLDRDEFDEDDKLVGDHIDDEILNYEIDNGIDNYGETDISNLFINNVIRKYHKFKNSDTVNNINGIKNEINLNKNKNISKRNIRDVRNNKKNGKNKKKNKKNVENNNSTEIIVQQSCFLCIDLGCPAFFRKIGYNCIPDDNDY